MLSGCDEGWGKGTAPCIAPEALGGGHGWRDTGHAEARLGTHAETSQQAASGAGTEVLGGSS